MSNTVQISMPVDNPDIREQLIAKISTLDFEGFEEKDDELIAFISEESFDPSSLQAILKPYQIGYTKAVIEEQNWNAIWESNFEPVIVDDFCVIRADFHTPFHDKQHEIIITPKMSFGTGHHATTYMMISEMRKINFKNKQAADFGTGTGVLAILADKLGADHVLAIDNDDWSIANSKENIEKNGCKNVIIEKTDRFVPMQKFDIILANINKNVILANVDNLVNGARPFCQLLLSGLLKEDETDILTAFVSRNFKHKSTVEKKQWICLLLEYDVNF